MKDEVKKLDVSQSLKDVTGKEDLKLDGKPITLQTCLSIILNADHTDLPIADQSEVNKVLIKTSLANDSVSFSQPQYDVLKKLCDKQKPSTNPFINQISICCQIRDMVNAAALVEHAEFSAIEPTNRIAKKSKSEADGELVK